MGGEIEEGRGGKGMKEIWMEEAVEREANGFERVEIGEVGLGENIALLDGFVEESAAVEAEGHRR